MNKVIYKESVLNKLNFLLLLSTSSITFSGVFAGNVAPGPAANPPAVARASQTPAPNANDPDNNDSQPPFEKDAAITPTTTTTTTPENQIEEPTSTTPADKTTTPAATDAANQTTAPAPITTTPSNSKNPIIAPSPPPPITTTAQTIVSPPSVPLSEKTYQQIMENPTNPWLNEDASLDAKARIDRMRASSAPAPTDVKMQSLYPAWKEAVDKYPPWVEALLSSYPPWTPTAYATGYKTWNMGTNDPQGLALALAESHYNIGNIDSFNSYIKSLETSGLIPGTKFVKKGDSLENAAPLDTASGTDGIVNLSPDTNPLIASYLLLQNGVNFWESPDPMGKLRGMCYIMAAKAQISIAKAQVLGYPADLITNAKVPAAQAFSKAKDAGTAADAKTLSSIYEIIVSATMDTVKSIGLVSPNQNKTAPVVKDPRISTLITDADAKISYVIGIISQGMTSGSQSQQIGSLRTVVQQIQTAQLAISAQNTPKPPPVIPQTPNP